MVVRSRGGEAVYNLITQSQAFSVFTSWAVTFTVVFSITGKTVKREGLGLGGMISHLEYCFGKVFFVFFFFFILESRSLSWKTLGLFQNFCTIIPHFFLTSSFKSHETVFWSFLDYHCENTMGSLMIKLPKCFGKL